MKRVLLNVPGQDRIKSCHHREFSSGKTSNGATDDGPLRKFLFRKPILIFPNHFPCLFKHGCSSLATLSHPVPSTADSLSKGRASNFNSLTSSRWIMLGCRSIVSPKESPRKKRLLFKYLLCKMISNAWA